MKVCVTRFTSMSRFSTSFVTNIWAVAMVAAHLNDLKAARGQGFKTIYVERPREEDWRVDSEDYKEAKGWVDLWITEDEEGFIAVAEKFDIH